MRILLYGGSGWNSTASFAIGLHGQQGRLLAVLFFPLPTWYTAHPPASLQDRPTYRTCAASPAMSIADDPPPPEQPDLQFDRAEFTAGVPEAVVCTACGTPINDRYFEAGGKVVCATCREAVERMFRGGPGLGRAFKALAFGTAAAAAGACLYYGIMKITGLNIGLVAVVVGLMVGRAVKSGSGHRGGRILPAPGRVPDVFGDCRHACSIPDRGDAAV